MLARGLDFGRVDENIARQKARLRFAPGRAEAGGSLLTVVAGKGWSD